LALLQCPSRCAALVYLPYRYTGQRWEDAIGLYFYKARWYDPARRRFIQPDSIVPEPGNPQALNRTPLFNQPLYHYTRWYLPDCSAK